MDNQATKYIKKILTKKECDLQVAKPRNHRVNTAKRAIQTFNSLSAKSVLAGEKLVATYSIST